MVSSFKAPFRQSERRRCFGKPVRPLWDGTWTFSSRFAFREVRAVEKIERFGGWTGRERRLRDSNRAFEAWLGGSEGLQMNRNGWKWYGFVRWSTCPTCSRACHPSVGAAWPIRCTSRSPTCTSSPLARSLVRVDFKLKSCLNFE